MFFIGACSTPPKVKPISPAEQMIQDRKLATPWVNDFEKIVHIRKIKSINPYLSHFGKKLIKNAPDLNAVPLEIVLLRDQENHFKGYGIPHNRVYLSVRFLQQLEFENELASAVSFFLAHIQKRYAVMKFETLDPKKTVLDKDFFWGSKGVLHLTEEELIDSIENSLNIVYQAGFDPRGMITVWKWFEGNPKSSPYPPELVQKLLERTRELLAMMPPLRNPVVRSEEFIQLKKRLEK